MEINESISDLDVDSKEKRAKDWALGTPTCRNPENEEENYKYDASEAKSIVFQGGRNQLCQILLRHKLLRNKNWWELALWITSDLVKNGFRGREEMDT